MRRCLPITLILLAALSSQAFGAESGGQSAAQNSLSALVRLVQPVKGSPADSYVRPSVVRGLAESLPLGFWLGLPGLDDGSVTEVAAPGPCRLAPPPAPTGADGLQDLHRMRPPVLRGP